MRAEDTKKQMDQDGNRTRAHDAIDANLKRVYEETLQEDIPARFRDLLQQLKAQESQRTDGSKE
ncbi:MAG: NepR family anti-sigma factor [Pseudomonadota bacterium]